MTLTGLYVPLITPYDTTGAVDLDTLDTLTHQILDAGATGIVALGTTAEPTALNPAEQHAVVDTIARACRQRHAPLLVGANTAATLHTLARRPEVTAALTLVPPFVRPGETAVLTHLTRLAADSPVPLVVYHVPYRTAQHLSVDTLRRLADVPGIIGVKYAPGTIDADTVTLLADPPEEFAILGGDDALISPLLALGAHGAILASAHLATAHFANLITAWHAGDTTTARATGHRLTALSTALFAEPNPTVVKAALHAQARIPTATVRPPLLPAHPETTTTALRHLDALDHAPATAR